MGFGKKIKNIGKKSLLTGSLILPLLFSGKPANSESEHENFFLSRPWIGVEYNHKRKYFSSTMPIYQNSYTYIDHWSNKDEIQISPGFNLTEEKKEEILNLISDVKNKKINSYNDFVQMSRIFSENQKLVIGALFADWIYKNSYDDIKNYEIYSKNILFGKFQKSLAGENEFLGACSNIAIYNESFLRDIGIKKVASVAGAVLDYQYGKRIEHAYNLLKLEDRISFIDGGQLLFVNTKNIEKALSAYQSEKDVFNFVYEFYENNQFKYKLITKEGRDYFEFVGHDPTADSFKKNVLEYEEKLSPLLNISFNDKSSEESKEINFLGFFLKKGKIIGSSNSLYDRIELSQFGFKKIGTLPKFEFKNNEFLSTFLNEFSGIVVGLQASAIKVEAFYRDITTAYFFENKKSEKIKNSTGNFFLSTNRPEGFNLGAEISVDSTILTNDSKQDIMASYKFRNGFFSINPYILFQFKNEDITLTPQSSGSSTEVSSGAILDFKLPKKIIFSVDPNISKRPWENEYGLGAKLKHKNFEISGKTFKTKSKYWANPNKAGKEITAKLDFRYLSGEVIYKTEIEDYDGEKEKNTELEVKTSLKY
jgi:hypothetical protein